jgi:hypothetical protein
MERYIALYIGYPVHHNQPYQFVFLCRPRHAEQQPRVTDETLDVRWCTEQEAAALPLDPNHVGRIEHAFRRWRGELPSAVLDVPNGVT